MKAIRLIEEKAANLICPLLRSQKKLHESIPNKLHPFSVSAHVENQFSSLLQMDLTQHHTIAVTSYAPQPFKKRFTWQTNSHTRLEHIQTTRIKLIEEEPTIDNPTAL